MQNKNGGRRLYVDKKRIKDMQNKDYILLT